MTGSSDKNTPETQLPGSELERAGVVLDSARRSVGEQRGSVLTIMRDIIARKKDITTDDVVSSARARQCYVMAFEGLCRAQLGFMELEANAHPFDTYPGWLIKAGKRSQLITELTEENNKRNEEFEEMMSRPPDSKIGRFFTRVGLMPARHNPEVRPVNLANLCCRPARYAEAFDELDRDANNQELAGLAGRLLEEELLKPYFVIDTVYDLSNRS